MAVLFSKRTEMDMSVCEEERCNVFIVFWICVIRTLRRGAI